MHTRQTRFPLTLFFLFCWAATNCCLFYLSVVFNSLSLLFAMLMVCNAKVLRKLIFFVVLRRMSGVHVASLSDFLSLSLSLSLARARARARVFKNRVQNRIHTLLTKPLSTLTRALLTTESPKVLFSAPFFSIPSSLTCSCIPLAMYTPVTCLRTAPSLNASEENTATVQNEAQKSRNKVSDWCDKNVVI